MNNQATKTNNDPRNIEAKILLRLNLLPNKNEIKVLYAFSGEGILWNEVKKRTSQKISILSIDKNDYKKVNLKGDNLKFLKGLNLSKYDIIDLDSWGSPSSQLQILANKNYKGVVHCTFIQTMQGRISNNILETYGYNKSMIKKCPTLFCKNALLKIMYFIYVKFGVTKIFLYQCNMKNYFSFQID